MTDTKYCNVRPGDKLFFTGEEWNSGSSAERYATPVEVASVDGFTIRVKESSFGTFPLQEVTESKGSPWRVRIEFDLKPGDVYQNTASGITYKIEAVRGNVVDFRDVRTGNLYPDFDSANVTSRVWIRLDESEITEKPVEKIEPYDSIVINSVAFPVKDSYGITDNLYIEKDDLILSIGTLDVFNIPYEVVKEDRHSFSDLETGLYGHQEGPSTLVKKSEDGTWKFPDRNHTPVLSAEDTAKAWYNQRDLRKVGFVD